jgi:hypothetical protein
MKSNLPASRKMYRKEKPTFCAEICWGMRLEVLEETL